jgi:hypothetical protein
MTHECQGTKQHGIVIRFADYRTAAHPESAKESFQMELGRTPLFDISFCPYCGARLWADGENQWVAAALGCGTTVA